MPGHVPDPGARQDLYEVMRSDVPFERKARAALSLGKAYLRMDFGLLTRTDTKTDDWEILAITDTSDGEFSDCLELDLSTSVFRQTMADHGQVAIHDVSNQGWADDPAFETHGINSFLGTTFVVNGDRYGTVCFLSGDPRREPFSEEETMFAELVSRMLERELERERQEAAITRQTNLAMVLNRVLRHNLRNDMTVIRGYTQLLADTIEDESVGEIALNHIDNLLALSQKARELDRTIAFEFEYEEADVVSLVEGIVDTIEDRYPSATIRFDHDGPVTATVLPSLERAIRELVENAAKHSGQTPTIRISLEADPNTVEIRIEDDGPGLDNNEVAVLETGTETPLAHGSGLGLWLTHWIVTSQDGHVDATVTDDGTTMTISVPRTPDIDVHQQVAQLQRTRDQYQAAFDEAVDAMVIVNDDARIIDANRRSTEIYGLERPKLLGREIPEFLPNDFDFEAEWRKFQDSRGVRDTVTIVGGDGVKREVEYTARTDIVPGLHLIVSRETNGHVA